MINKEMLRFHCCLVNYFHLNGGGSRCRNLLSVLAVNFSLGALNCTSHQQVVAAPRNWFVVNACFEAVSISELVKSQRELFKTPDFLRKKHFLKTDSLNCARRQFLPGCAPLFKLLVMIVNSITKP